MGVVGWTPSGPVLADSVPASSVDISDLNFDPATQAELVAALAAIAAPSVIDGGSP